MPSASTGKLTLRGEGAVLAGTPRRVRGHVEIHNAADDEVVLRALGVEGLRPGRHAVPVMATLAAGASVRVPLRLRLDPGTPPGRHEIGITAGDERIAVVVEVAESPRARISPPTLAVAGAAGDAVTRDITIGNLGNVPIPLDRLGALTIEERGGVCRSLESALRAEGGNGMQAFLDQAVREVAATRVDRLRVRARDDAPVEPGETRTVELQLRLPADLQAGRTYVGLLRLTGASLPVEVTALGEQADEDGAPARPARARRTARRTRAA